MEKSNQKLGVIALTALVIGGIIGWVGLIIPHICRMLVGQDSGRVFRLGQRVDVVLEAADARAGRLDFRLA